MKTKRHSGESEQSVFGTVLIKALSSASDELFEASMAWMREDIRNGWRCFHAREVWLAENLSEPLLSANGREYEVEKLLFRIAHSANDHRLMALPLKDIADYRNYLDPGSFDLWDPEGVQRPRDLVANHTITQLLSVQNRHAWFEIRSLMLRWREEAVDKIRLTTPSHFSLKGDASKAVREPTVKIERDVRYWSDIYGLFGHNVSWDIALTGMRLTVELMRNLAPQFRFIEHINTRTHLVFALEKGSDHTWAIVFDRLGPMEQEQIDFMPILVLLKTSSLSDANKKNCKLAASDFLFFDIFKSNILPIYEVHQLELHILFMLQTFRRRIDLYDRFVTVALRETSSQ